jgi:ankyrin repeat protein
MPRLKLDALLSAAYSGDLDAIDAHRNAGGDINLRRADGFTPLLVAIEGRHPELAAALIDRGADVRATMPGGFTALHVLIKQIRGRPLNFSVTSLRDGARVKLTDQDEIRRAIGSHPDDEYRAWLTLAEKLLAGGVDVEVAKEATGQRALRDAAEVSAELVALMLRLARPDVNARDDEGFTPLHMAARSGDPRAVDLLLSAGAEVDAAESYGFTPLHEAILHKRTDAARRLLAAGADPSKPLLRGYPPHKAGDDAHTLAQRTGLAALFGPAGNSKPAKARPAKVAAKKVTKVATKKIAKTAKTATKVATKTVAKVARKTTKSAARKTTK